MQQVSGIGDIFMNDEIKLDQYMICLEVVDYYLDANIVFWLDYLEKHIQGKIHILSYRTIKEEIQKNTLVISLYGY